jgi:alanyl-tRNA synthetase
MEYLRSVASNIVVDGGVVALLGSAANGSIVLAKSEGVPGDMNALLREAVKACGGKGGGTKDFAQGSVPQGSDLSRILEHAAIRVSKPPKSLHVVPRNSVTVRSQGELWRFKSKVRV